MYRTTVAYLLWLVSGCGALGFHRFYLGKVGTGLLWFVTGGLGMIGAIFDFFYIPTMVRRTNFSLSGTGRFQGPHGSDKIWHPDTSDHRIPKGESVSVEHAILSTAKKNRGIVTPGEVALETGISIDEAKEHLEKLAKKGYADLRIRKIGVVVYTFPEFSEENQNNDFVDI